MKKFEIHIPSPCHENWDAMMPEAQGRFCAACKKTVIDFSEMTDSQLVAFFQKPLASECGRFHADQLDRVIHVPRKRIPWLKYFFTISIPAFLLSLKTSAQKTECVKPPVEAGQRRIGRIRTVPATEKVASSRTIQGRVMDENGEGIPGATVMIPSANRTTVCDEEGGFEFKGEGVDADSISIEVSSIGFSSRKLNIAGTAPMTIVLRKTQHLMEPVVITSDKRIYLGRYAGGFVIVRQSSFPVTGIIRKLVDTAFSRFSVHPNPATPGTSVSILLKRQAEGAYEAELLNSAGACVQRGEFFVTGKKEKISLPIPRVADGVYILSLRHKESGKVLTEKIVIR